jgi:hypothetical protein
LYDRLADRFGEGRVFIDMNAIEPGVDFAEAIFRAVAACQVLLAIIGPGWLTVTDSRDGRRLDDPDDIVRLEIEAALARGVLVIPILVEGAIMPARQDLPPSLSGLTRRQALTIQHESFRYDAGRLVTAIERILAPAPDGAGVSNAPDRLLTEAEYIANATTDELSKASSLSSIAWAVAGTDPDRAEHIVYSITDEATRARALSRIAKVIADTDRDRATRLLTDAEYIANSVTDEYSKASSLDSVVDALAAIDSYRAERIARSITYESSKASALSSVARAVATTDPDRAERIADSITDESSKASLLTYIAKRVSKSS